MNKDKKVVFFSLAALFLLIVVFMVLNKGLISNIGDEKVDGTMLFTLNGNKHYVSFEDVEKLPSEKFDAEIRSSSRKPEEVVYTAVKLVDILDSLNEDYSNSKKAVIKAEDFYTSAVSIDDINIDGNVYIAYKVNGKYMKSKKDGGDGPFQLIVRKDNFSQRWVKYVVEVELQ